MPDALASHVQVRDAVRARYAAAARTHLEESSAGACGCDEACCGGHDRPGLATTSGCCDTTCCGEASKNEAADPISSGLYDEADTPFDAALAASLGCGNPTALAELNAGEVVLDLGSGGGLDVLLSARRVAPDGRAYGLDMTPEMLQLAERNKAQAGVENASFMLGTIEDVPLPEESVDVVISNCVINLSADKDAVLAEAFRVLRAGGRFAVSDIVLVRDIPDELRGVVALWTGCISGALRDTAYVDKLTAAGFTQASVEITRRYDRAELEAMADQLDPSQVPAGISLDEAVDALDGAFASAFVRAAKPSR